VPVPSRGRYSLRSLSLHPLQSVGVKYSQVTVVLLAVVASKDVQLFIVKSGCVIFYLRGHLALGWLGTAIA
jgi:hypothetical protein